MGRNRGRESLVARLLHVEAQVDILGVPFRPLGTRSLRDFVREHPRHEPRHRAPVRAVREGQSAEAEVVRRVAEGDAEGFEPVAAGAAHLCELGRGGVGLVDKGAVVRVCLRAVWWGVCVDGLGGGL